MQQNPPCPAPWRLFAALGLVVPVALAMLLRGFGPTFVTAHTNGALMPLYLAPPLLSFLAAAVLGVRALVARAGRYPLLGVSLAGVLLTCALLVFGVYCLLYSGIGVQDGGWDRG